MFTHRFQLSALLALLLVGAALLPAKLQAQQIVVANRGQSAAPASIVGKITPVTALPIPVAGPLRAPASSIRPLQVNPLEFTQPQSEDGRVHAGSSVAMMGTGAAAVVVGLLVGGEGGTLLALGGGIFGLAGLYRFLR